MQHHCQAQLTGGIIRLGPSESPVLKIEASNETQLEIQNHHHNIQPLCLSPVRSHRAYQINQQLVQITPTTNTRARACSSVNGDDRCNSNGNVDDHDDSKSTCPIRICQQSPTTPTPAPRKSLYERRNYENLIDLSLTTRSDNNININNSDSLFQHQQQQYQSYQKLHQLQQQQQEQQQQFYSGGNIYETINYEQVNSNNKQITSFKTPTSTAPPIGTGLVIPASFHNSLRDKPRLVNGGSLNLINYGKLTKDCNIHLIYLSLKKDTTALDMGDREWLYCKVKNVFLGKALVDWLENNVCGFKNRQEAFKFAKEFLSSNLIESPFKKDKNSFSERRYYGFKWNLLDV